VSSVPRVRGEDAKPKRVGVTGADDGSPDAASARRNSTQRREKDSVSSVFSSSNGRGRTGELAVPGLMPIRCSPARTRSSSDQERMEARSPSISNRFVSSRGVLRKVSNMLVTSLRSTLVFADPRRRRRKASIRCSLIITASWRSLPIRRVFSFTSCSCGQRTSVPRRFGMAFA